MKRLSDTAAIVKHMQPKDKSACPDAGRAITARMNIPGQLRYSYDSEGKDGYYCNPEPGVGGVSLKSAVMTLNGGTLTKVKGGGRK